jgi:hypothetical protein
LMHCRRAGLAREGKAVLARVAASAMPLPRTTPPPPPPLAMPQRRSSHHGAATPCPARAQ